MSGTYVQRLSADSIENPNIKKDYGHFTFQNGDAYTGDYMIVEDKKFIARQGRGIYVTGDFNKYETSWIEDRIVNEVHIRYNNETQYKGTLGTDGEMLGFGTYTFIDNSHLEATWKNNEPVEDIILKDPLGSIWEGVRNGKEVEFTAENHFWNETSSSIDNEKEFVEKKDAKNSDDDPNYLES